MHVCRTTPPYQVFTTRMVPVLLCLSVPCTMVVWSYFLHQPHAVTTHLQSHCCMWLLIFKVILLSIYNPTALDDSWRVISPFCNTVPGLYTCWCPCLLMVQHLIFFWAALYSGVPSRSLGSGSPLSAD